MIKATDPEFKIQADFIQYVKLKYPDLLYTISPAGFIMSAGMAMKMMRMGYRKGTPDVMIFEPRGCYHGLFLEFKAPDGKVADSQIEFKNLALKKPYGYTVVYNTEAAITVLESYLNYIE